MTKKINQEIKFQGISVNRQEQRNVMKRVALMARFARIHQQKRG